MFSIDGAVAELQDVSTQNSTKNYQKGHKRLFFEEKVTPSNSEIASFATGAENVEEKGFEDFFCFF